MSYSFLTIKLLKKPFIVTVVLGHLQQLPAVKEVVPG